MRVAWPLLERSWREEAPSHWAEARVGEVALLTNGYPFDSATFGPSGAMPLARIRDLGPGPLETWVPDPVPPAVVLRDGDVVIGMDGDFNLAWWNKGPAALNQRLCLLRAKEDRVLQRYLVYVLPRTLGVINDLTYFTTVKHLASGDLLAEKLLLPPVEEQRRIVEYLDTETARIDELLAELHRLGAVIAERSMSEQQRLATQGCAGERLISSRLSWLGDVPASWQVVPLKSVARMESGHTPSRSRPELWEDCYIPWISLNDVGKLTVNEYIDSTVNLISLAGVGASSARVLPAGTVVLSRDATIGRTSIMAVPMATSQHFAAWVCGPRLEPRYLWLLFTTAMQTYLGSLCEGSTIRTIGMPELRTFKIPLPPVEEQQRIIDEAESARVTARSLAEEIGQQAALLREHRQALITAAVTGGLEAVGRVA